MKFNEKVVNEFIRFVQEKMEDMIEEYSDEIALGTDEYEEDELEEMEQGVLLADMMYDYAEQAVRATLSQAIIDNYFVCETPMLDNE